MKLKKNITWIKMKAKYMFNLLDQKCQFFNLIILFNKNLKIINIKLK